MPLFDDQTPEVIRDRILSRMGTDLQTREGSYTYDQVSPMSFELWRWHMTLDELFYAFYVNEYSGHYLDDHANLLGMLRRVGTKAAAEIHFTGRSGVTVPAGTAFFTEAGLEFDLVYDVLLANGVGTGYLMAAQVGDKYNVDPGEINQILRNISGLESYTNDAAVGGTDPEGDTALFGRIDAHRKNPVTSGNPNHYKEWALSCNGVGAVKVTERWKGPGTVRVLITGYNLQSVDEAVVTACAEYIETQRPVGAEVTVQSAEEMEIHVEASVLLKKDASLAAVKAAFVSELDTCLKELAGEYFKVSDVRPYTLHYNKVAALLMGIDGVIDFTSLSLNGGASNVTIEGTATPVRGGVTVS